MPILLALLAAGAIRADETLPTPMLADEKSIALPVSAAVKSATIKELSTPIARPVRFTLLCSVLIARGRPLNCIQAEDPLPGTWDAFENKAFALALRQSGPTADPVLKVALDRIHEMRVHVPPGQASSGKTLMTFVETGSPDDAIPDPAPAETLSQRDVVIERGADGEMLANLYPEIAIRNGILAKVVVTCRVIENRHLICRDGSVSTVNRHGDPVTNGMGRDFRLASYQVVSTIVLGPKTKDGRDAVGRDVTMAINWSLPSD